MTAAIGNDAVFVPILPSLDKFFTETQKGSKQAGERAGKSFSDALSKSVEQAERRVNTTSRAYERAQNRATDAADKTRLAETKLAEVMENGNATASQVQTATNNLNKARRDQVAAENNAESASKDLTRAQENLTKAQQEQDDATTESTDGMKDWSLSAEEAQKASEDLETAQKTLEIGIAATATALVGAIGGLVNIGSSFHDMSRQIAVGSGATGDDLRALEESAMSVATTVPVSFEESADALATLNTLTGESGPVLEDLTSQVLEASNLLGEDGTANAEKFGTALSLWEVDAATGAEALDGLFTITQDYGVSLSDLSGTLTTYGSVLKNVGFSMEESAVLFGSLEKAGISVSRIMPGMNKAFRDWADEGLNVREELTKVVDQVAETEDGTEALAIATEAFGAQGASRLTTAIRNGSFALEDFEDVLGDTEGAIANTAEENRTLEESFQLMKNEALVAIEPLATELFDRLVPAVELAGEKLVEAIEWIQENEELVKGLAVSVGVAATALLGFRTAAMAVEAAMRVKNVMLLLSTTGWKGLNAVMRRNVIGLIVTAIAGLVAGLVYFFRETETGQEMWARFTEALSNGWDWVVGTLTTGWEWLRDHVFTPLWTFVSETVWPILQSVFGFISDAWSALADGLAWAYENLIKPTFDFFVTAGKFLFAVLTTAVFTPLLIAWEVLSAGISWYWENVTKPAWEMLQTAAIFMWENVLQPVFGWIQDGWQRLADGIAWVYENIILGTWNALQDAATWMYENVLMPVFGFIQERWEILWGNVRRIYFEVIKPTWDALQDAATWMYEKVLEPVFRWIGDRWSDMGDTLDRIGTWINDNVFVPMGDAVNTVKGWFETAVDGIGKAWEKLKELTAKPINFVIEFVYGSVKKAWDAVANLVDLPELPTIKKIGGYAEGTARVPGVRTRHDNVHMVSTDGRFGLSLRGDEGVLVPEAVDSLGESTVNDLNRLGLTQGKAGVDRYLEHRFLGGFSQGGFVGPIRRQTPFFGGAVSDVQRSQETFVERFFPGVFTLTSATRPGDPGHHGSGLATDWQDNGAQWPTPNSKALSRAIATNFPHTLELIHWPNDGWSNISNGQPADFGSPTNEQHANHVHWATQGPVVFDGDDIRLDGGGAGGGVWESITSMGKRIWDGIIDLAPSYKNEPDAVGGWVGDMPGKFLTRLAGAAWDWVKEKLDAVMGFFGGGSGGAEQWRELSRTALRRHGYNPDDHIEAMLQQIDIESGGDPTAENFWDSNAAAGHPSGGLLQVIEPTYQDVRRLYPEAFEGLPDDRFHPLTNLTAGVGAVKRDWGGPAGRWPTRGGYHAGGLAPAGEGWLQKTALEPEFVLSPDMTEAFIDWMRGTPHGESAAVVAREVAEAFAGEDWGYGELARYIGADLAESTIEVVQAIGRADRGFRQWAAADEERGRMGTPQEWALHFGADAAATVGDDLLGLVGLGGIIGSTPNESLLDLLQVGAENLNDVYGWNLPVLSGEELKPMVVIDDEGRAIGTVIEIDDEEEDDDIVPSAADVAEPVVASTTTAADTTAADTATSAAGGKREVVLQIDGDAVSTETLNRSMEKLSEELGDVTVRVEKLEGQMTASVVAGAAAGIV